MRVYGNLTACGRVVNCGGLFVRAVYLKLSVTSPQDYYYYYYTKKLYLFSCLFSIWNSEKGGGYIWRAIRLRKCWWRDGWTERQAYPIGFTAVNARWRGLW